MCLCVDTGVRSGEQAVTERSSRNMSVVSVSILMAFIGLAKKLV